MRVLNHKFSTILVGQSHVLHKSAWSNIFENPQRSYALVFVTGAPCPLCKTFGVRRFQCSKSE